MKKAAATDTSLAVLVLAPHGRDSALAESLLQDAGLTPAVVTDVDQLMDCLQAGAGAVVVTEEALTNIDLTDFHTLINDQPPWADIPIILLTHRGGGSERNPAARRLSTTLGNVSFLERPFHPTTFVSLAEAALRSRRRQYEARDRLEDLSTAEEALRSANVTLEQRVIERTARLEEAQAALHQSQKMEAVGQLTGGIAHDFNNMLTGVTGALDIIRRRIATGRLDDIDRFMDAASTSAMRAAGLTARLLAFSRRQSLDNKPTDVGALAYSLEDLLVRTMGERISIAITQESQVPFALVDPNQLESAILNLAINARDAMPDGGQLTIEVGTVNIDQAYSARLPGIEPGHYVAITVTDTGVGMDETTLEKVFEPFFTTKPIGQGTGLGLSMVYGFAQQSKGHVRLHSTLGVGTSVKIFLPIAEARADTPAERTRPATLEGDGQSVLLVEDDASVRLLIGEVLIELGYAMAEAADPDSAIALLRSGRPFDLMISDVGLPGMNGRQLAEIARAQSPDLPILFVTGYAENAAIRADFLGTNMAMITKPFQIETLSAKIREMLEHA